MWCAYGVCSVVCVVCVCGMCACVTCEDMCTFPIMCMYICTTELYFHATLRLYNQCNTRGQHPVVCSGLQLEVLSLSHLLSQCAFPVWCVAGSSAITFVLLCIVICVLSSQPQPFFYIWYA